MLRTRTLTLLLILLASSVPGSAQDLVFDTGDFRTWNYPEGLITVADDGVQVKRFGTTFNAAADIDEHSSVTIGQFGSRVTRTPSNQFSADRIRDQDETTWWKPNPNDDVQLWWIELDLGRAVVADKIRVIFPDEEGARPFRYFSVFTSPGIPVFGSTTPRIVYNRVGRPINDNESQVVELPLQTTGLSSAAGEHVNPSSTANFDFVRFIRFEAAASTPDAALAEIEVDGIGFNLSGMVGTPTRREEGEAHWGGTTWTSKDRDCAGCGKGSGADEMLDEDLGFREWTIEGSDKGDWRKSGVWQTIDFGSVFRVNRVVFLPIVGGRSEILYGYQRDKQGGWSNLDFLTSDGTPSNTADPVTEGPYHYELLSEITNSGRTIFDLEFEPLDMRMFLWRVTDVPQFSRALQLWIFHAEGYPRQVVLESGDLALGGARSIRTIEWEADTPPGTRIEVDTQTGNGFDTLTRYFLINGNEVTKEAYESAKSRNRGDIVTEEVRDDTWSAWSLPHRFSGQEFQSPSPRAWLRTRVRLISEDPEVMPTLHALRLVANAPVVASGLTGSVLPREAAVDSLQEFRFTIKPSGTSFGDVGFDRVVIEIPPGAADLSLTSTTIGGDPVDAAGEVRGDSLIVSLPPPAVRRDSVEIAFRTRLQESPTVFNAMVLNSGQTGNTQGVVPVAFGSQRVFLPDAIAGTSLIRNLDIPEAFSPNGDGINDVFDCSFVIVKTDREPKAAIYNLAGQLVAELGNTATQDGRARFQWDGDVGGSIAPPGIYLLRVEIDSDARNERVHRVVHVVY